MLSSKWLELRPWRELSRLQNPFKAFLRMPLLLEVIRSDVLDLQGKRARKSYDWQMESRTLQKKKKTSTAQSWHFPAENEIFTLFAGTTSLQNDRSNDVRGNICQKWTKVSSRRNGNGSSGRNGQTEQRQDVLAAYPSHQFFQRQHSQNGQV